MNCRTHSQTLHSEKVTTRPSVAVCILFFEKPIQTIECVRSFVPSGVPIYVLNNGSSEEARELFEEHCGHYPNVHILDSFTNLGVAGGRNVLINHTSEDWLFFADSDLTIVTRDWLERLHKHIAWYTDTDCFFPHAYNVHDDSYVPLHHYVKKEDGTYRSERAKQPVVNAFFGCMACSRKVFERIGLLDENLFGGHEDYELAVRALHKDMPFVTRRASDIELIHDHQFSSLRTDVDATHVRYDTELFKKNKNYLEKTLGLITGDATNWAEEQIEYQTQAATDRPSLRLPYQLIILANSRTSDTALEELLHCYPEVSSACIDIGSDCTEAVLLTILNTLHQYDIAKLECRLRPVESNCLNLLVTLCNHVTFYIPHDVVLDEYLRPGGPLESALITAQGITSSITVEWALSPHRLDAADRLRQWCAAYRPVKLRLHEPRPDDLFLYTLEQTEHSPHSDPSHKLDDDMIFPSLSGRRAPNYCTCYTNTLVLDGDTVGSCPYEQERSLRKVPLIGDFCNAPLLSHARTLQSKGLAAHAGCLHCWRNYAVPSKICVEVPQKPRVLLVPDILNWAYDNICTMLSRKLSDEFDFTKQYNALSDKKSLFASSCFDATIIFWHANFCDTSIAHALAQNNKRDSFIDKAFMTPVFSFTNLENIYFSPLSHNINLFIDLYSVANHKINAAYTCFPGIASPWGLLADSYDDALFVPNENRSFGKHESLRVGWAGNSQWGNNLANMNDPKGFHSVVVPLLSELQKSGKFVAHFADRNVRWREHHEMPQYYSEIDVLLNASAAEGGPVPVLESMACGVPIVSTDCGCVPEVFGPLQQQFIVPRNVQAFKKALLELQRNPDLRQAISEENIRQVASWSHSVRAQDWRVAIHDALRHAAQPATQQRKRALLNKIIEY